MHKLALLAATALIGGGAQAQPIGLRDTFPIGTGAGTLCTANVASNSKAIADMFDQAWAITCRDAAVPVGHVYALRLRGEDPAARLQKLRAQEVDCGAAAPSSLDELGQVQASDCRMRTLDVGYRVYQSARGDKLYVAEGLAGYDSALRLGLRTIVADRPVEGEVQVATTGAGDPAAFARAQAGTLDPSRALAEAYRRNNAGNYAEAAEFFGALLGNEDAQAAQSEALVNQALQQSNLGNYTEAESQFGRARALTGGDPLLERMYRNYRAMHLMNQGRPAEALEQLGAPVQAGPAPAGGGGELVINAATAARLNAESPVSRQFAGAGSGLLPEEKLQILEGQADHLRATILRLQGRRDEASAGLRAALARLAAVRGGRVASTVWMRGQMLGELAAIAEESGDGAEAERQHQSAVALIESAYPGSAALTNARARYAAYLSRSGRAEQSLALYNVIVDENAQPGRTPSPQLRRTLSPYFALLAERAADPQNVARMFKASQILIRPGVAQTQAVLARELSGGSDEAARLFRQSVTLTRDIERTRVELARLTGLAAPTDSDLARVAELRPQLATMERDQAATQARLADFPRYRVVSGGAMELADLQRTLQPGEGYYKMVMAGDAGYAIFATQGAARAFRIGMGAAELDAEVDALRATISVVEDGQLLTYPFDVARAHKLYASLMQPVEADLAGVRHLIFEPDGAMLRLPPNLLVAERAGVDAYLAKATRPDDDGFDFTMVKWLGSDRDISTAVSAQSFRDVRAVDASGADNAYLGFGENAPPDGVVRTAGAVRGFSGAEAEGCAWSTNIWGRPISAAELMTARQVLGAGSDSEIVTGAQFTDTAIKRRDDLSEYRILHFATHGLVTAPREDCPARPALLTSFGESENSDGLLTFAEIFDLRLDADLVILSACDTAGKASVEATREAGLASGGDFALDGLVRAFVGAGGRSVIASHWPVPDDYNATQRLISGLFIAPAGTSTAAAMRGAQAELMRDPATSHPYYWSGFAIIGDGARPVRPAS